MDVIFLGDQVVAAVVMDSKDQRTGSQMFVGEVVDVVNHLSLVGLVLGRLEFPVLLVVVELE
jgi:hypothetical protein